MCGLRMEVEIEGERVTSIRGDVDDPFSRGHICPKANALSELHDDPDRLRRPLVRRGGKHEEISWEDALTLVAERLHEVQETHGRDAVGVYIGNPNVHNLGTMMYGPNFLRTLRTKNRFSATSVDQLPHMLTSYLMFGHQLMLPVPDVDRTQLMVIVGANPIASNGSLMSAPGVRRRLREIKERGGRVIVIDPRVTETARVASEHHFVRPGTDSFFLLRVLARMFERGPRLGRLSEITDGLADARAAVATVDAKALLARTGIDEETALRIADALYDTDGAVLYGRMGTATVRFGALNQWLINLINLTSGGLDREGGAMFTTPALDSLQETGGLGVGRGAYDRFQSRVRGLPEFGGELPVSTLAEEIETSGERQIRAMITVAGNPVLSTPNSDRTDRALSTLDFMVSVDIYLNETTRHADVILPPVSPLSRPHYDAAFHVLAVRNTAKFSLPLFPKPDDAKHDWEILSALTMKLLRLRGSRRAWLRARALHAAGPEGLLDLGLRAGPYGPRAGVFGSGLTLSRLKTRPHGIDYGPLEPRLPERLPTGRINAAPKRFLADLDRLQEEPAREGLLLIGRRHVRSNNSWMHNLPSLMKGRARSALLMHPNDAARRGLTEAHQVIVKSRVGEVVTALQLSSDMMPGVVSLPHGFGQSKKGTRQSVAVARESANANVLTDEEDVDIVSGNAVLNGVPVEVFPHPDAKA